MKPAIRCLVSYAERTGAAQQERDRRVFRAFWQTMQACIDRGMNTEGVLPARCACHVVRLPCAGC